MKPELIEIPILRDQYGFIGVIEGDLALPFEVRRFYFIGDIDPDATRGSHAHRSLTQLIVAMRGSVVVHLEDGETSERFDLTGPSMGLLVPPGYWRTLDSFARGTVVGVLASDRYDEADYIRSYREFKEWARAR